MQAIRDQNFSSLVVPGYPSAIVIRRLIRPDQLTFLQGYYLEKLMEGFFCQDTHSYKNRLYLRNDPIGTDLLKEYLDIVEKAVGVSLLSCYSFVSFYRRGSILKRHLDKSECEFTMGAILFSSHEKASRRHYLSLGNNEAPVHINLEAGEGAVFQGAITPHWRDSIDEEFLCTLLLHYKQANS